MEEKNIIKDSAIANCYSLSVGMEYASMIPCDAKDLRTLSKEILRCLTFMGDSYNSDLCEIAIPWLNALMEKWLSNVRRKEDTPFVLLPPISDDDSCRFDRGKFIKLFAPLVPSGCIGSSSFDLSLPSLSSQQRQLLLHAQEIIDIPYVVYYFENGCRRFSYEELVDYQPQKVFEAARQQRLREKPISDRVVITLRSQCATLQEAIDSVNQRFNQHPIVQDYINSMEQDINHILRRWNCEGKFLLKDLIPLYDYLNLRDAVTREYDPQLYYRLHPDQAPKPEPKPEPELAPSARETALQVGLAYRDKHSRFFHAAERAGLISWHDDHYETNLKPILVDYLLGRGLCGDTVKETPQGRLWQRGPGVMPRRQLKLLFPHYDVGSIRTRRTAPSSDNQRIPADSDLVAQIDQLLSRLKKS